VTLREYAAALALGLLVGAVVGGLVVAVDVQPVESIDDALGDDELAGIEDGPRYGESPLGTAAPTDTGETQTATDRQTATEPGGTETATAAADTRTTTDTGGGQTATGTTTATQAAFVYQIDEVTECGTTCRTVTATVTNQQSTDADVTSETQIYAGNTTAADARVFAETRELGSVAAGGSVTTSTDVELSTTEAFAVQDADGWITVVTVISDGDDTVRTVERRQVL
jgi:hypothetical protein